MFTCVQLVCAAAKHWAVTAHGLKCVWLASPWEAVPGHTKSKTEKPSLPPVSICEHLQMHLSLSASFVLKSFPGWLMLLILPAVPVSPLR